LTDFNPIDRETGGKEDFNTGLRMIEKIGDRKYRKRFALLWRNEFLGLVNIHPKIDTYLKNALSIYYRDLLSWSEKDLRGSEKDLRGSEKDIRWAERDLKAKG
jgi:hypothetical protein